MKLDQEKTDLSHSGAGASFHVSSLTRMRTFTGRDLETLADLAAMQHRSAKTTYISSVKHVLTFPASKHYGQ